MMAFNLYIFIILVALLLFLIINDIFKLINIVNLFDGLLYFYLIIISIVFIDSISIVPYLTALGIGLIVYLTLYIYSLILKNNVYLLLKYCKKDYNIIKDTLEKQTNKDFSFKIYKKFPMLIIIKKANKLIFKQLKTAIKNSRKKNFTIYNYWQIIILIIIITVIIRF